MVMINGMSEAEFMAERAAGNAAYAAAVSQSPACVGELDGDELDGDELEWLNLSADSPSLGASW